MTKASASSDVHDAAPDPVLRCIDALRDPGGLQTELEAAWSSAGEGLAIEHVEVRLVHYRPHRGGRLIVLVEGRDAAGASIRQDVFIQVFLTVEAAHRRYDRVRKHPLRSAAPPVVLLSSWPALAWSLPNGPRLRPAKVGFRPKKLRRLLRKLARNRELPVECVPRRPTPPRLVRYVPRKRALFRLDPIPGWPLGALYLKVYEPGRYQTARKNLKQVRRAYKAGELRFKTPRVVVSSRRRRTVVMTQVPGRPLTDVMYDNPVILAQVGDAIASLHAGPVVPASTWTASGEYGALGSAADDLTLALPELAAPLDELRGVLGPLTPDVHSSRPIHGNLFGDQILIKHERVSIVDWDDLAVGDPMYDVGRLSSHVVYVGLRDERSGASVRRAVDDLCRAYGAGGGEIDPPRFRWHVLTAMVIRVKISALRPVPDGWAGLTRDIVRRTVDAAGAGDDWFDVLTCDR